MQYISTIMSSSAICSHFTQNAWKKDLCSNCFKSKDEHKQANSSFSTSKFSSALRSNNAVKVAAATNSMQKSMENDHRKTDYPNRHKMPAKSIIKTKSLSSKISSKSKSYKVSFRKTISEVIGYGGEWSDNDSDDDDHDFMNLANERDDNAATSTDDEETLELKRITRANTDFNMNNGNLLGDPQDNIKRSFAALKLGAPQVDKEGKKQTLKINVLPFGATAASTPIAQATTAVSGTESIKPIPIAAEHSTAKAKFESKSNAIETLNSTQAKAMKKAVTTPVMKMTATPVDTSASKSPSKIVMSSTYATSSTIKQDIASSSDSDGKNSPPIERAMEKSLLDEISETLEQKQSESKKLADAQAATSSKIKFEITSLSETIESSNKPFLELKKPIARNPPITKEHAKPKINIFHKYSDTDSNCSDGENSISAYYDVVEAQISYENLPDGKCAPTGTSSVKGKVVVTKEINATDDSNSSNNKNNNKQKYSSSQYITDILLSSKTRAASYNLHEGNFISSKITSDGLIVTKCSSEDALDSTGSSFDGSSDEEASYNMIRSESDSGIGISIGNEYKNIQTINEKDNERPCLEKKLSVSTNNSDYEDIQVVDQRPALPKPNPPQPAGKKQPYVPEKSRELHGEPDGSADPDGSLENKGISKKDQSQQLPALPKSPPPSKLIDARPSFLHGLQKQHPPILLKKPDLPAKPIVTPLNSPLKTFITKRQPTNVEQQVISQLQMVMSKSIENINADLAKDDPKLKKGRAPNPPPEHKSSAPPTPERDYNISIEFEHQMKGEEEQATSATAEVFSKHQQTTDEHHHLLKQQQPKSKLEEDDTKKLNVRTEIDKFKTKPTTAPTATTTTTSAISSSGEATATNSTSAASSGTVTNIYTRKSTLTTLTSNNNNNNNIVSVTKNSASPVVREKEKRERAVINPKFRSLNTFVTQRNNAAKNIQLQAATSSLNLKHPMTPEPVPRSQQKSNFSMSEECLTGAGAMAGLDKKPLPPQKAKTKFSIKKFLRMGASKTTDNLHKRDNGYSEICTGEDTGVVGKPRLVIIHPIDINPTAVEVVKDITKTNDSVNAQTIAVLTSKPPAPPLRATDAQRATELNKPARPPPPKSAELRRKQQINLESSGGVREAGGSIKSKADNVYANLGEIRSAIAPRKPERTASMREREAQLELVRKRHENTDTISICSSNGEIVSAAADQKAAHTEGKGLIKQYNNSNGNTSTLSPQLPAAHSGRTMTDGKPPSGSRTSTFERKKSDTKIAIASKLEIFENRNNNKNNTYNIQNANNNSNNSTNATTNTNANSLNQNEGRPSSLKDSVRKINSTIDSYLKDKRDYENMYDFIKSPAAPPPPPARSVDSNADQRMLQPRRPNLYSDTASVASYTRSEYGPTRNYGLNSSLANIPRIISASYCGSEAGGEFDIYAPYSYYGSEAGGDLAADINDSVWGLSSANKNRVKATNRLRMRKGRSVVHKTIEDNYTAVVVANHEALAQVLDQLQQSPVVPPQLRPLANAINLRFEDFTILDGAQAFVVGKKAFHSAMWTTVQVTLALSADCNQLSGVGGEMNQLSGGVSGVLNPITEFCDIVPSYHLPLMPTTEVTLMQATISVLPRLQLDTLQSIGTILKGKSQVLDKSNFNFRGSIPNLAGLKETFGSNALRNVMSVQNLSTLNEESSLDKSAQAESDATSISNLPGMPAFDDVMTREVAFIMLQLVNGMKSLQAKAIEEMPLSLSNVVLSKDVDNKDAQARLCVLQGNNNDEDEPMGTLCKCAHIALTEMLPMTRISTLLGNLLEQERAESLSKAKSVLEFVLWGPSDVVLSGSTKERELALQRWLDLERATVLHGLVRTRIELTIYDECHLMFLVRSTAKMMNDAAKIVCSFQQPLMATKE